jgi:hypothetical protein
MPELKTYRLFISHAWTHNEEYLRLEKMFKDTPNFRWQNYSVPEHDQLDASSVTELTENLEKQMKPTNVVIIISGMYAAYRKWIQKEMDMAKDMKKPIVGVKPWGQERTPEAVKDAANEMVGWKASSIVGAVRRWAL